MTEPNELPKWERKYRNYHKALSRLAEIVNTAKKRELNERAMPSIRIFRG